MAAWRALALKSENTQNTDTGTLARVSLSVVRAAAVASATYIAEAPPAPERHVHRPLCECYAAAAAAAAAGGASFSCKFKCTACSSCGVATHILTHARRGVVVPQYFVHKRRRA